MTAPTSTPRRWTRLVAFLALGLLAVVVAAAFLLDRLLTSAAQDQAARLSAAWQRPVEVGAVRTRFLAGLGLRVDGVRVGAAAGESRPLLELDQAEVKLDLLRALRSGGRELHVESAELRGLRVNVLRLADGTTSLERFQEAVGRGASPAGAAGEGGEGGEGAAGAPPGGAAPDRSRLRVDHAALRDARIAFLDQARGGPELFVDHLDLVVDGFAAGQPLELVLKAGLLSATQNLELRVHAPPLPPSLVPAPDRIALKVEPVDLTPLAPFVPAQAGFRGGRLSADLEVALGAAVAGGEGATSLRGGFKATGLRFAGQQGGKALDVTLDADLSADTRAGDLVLTRLQLAFGPASVEGRGRVSGLLSGSPKVEGLRLVARDLDPAALTPYYPALPRLLGGTVAGPIGLSVQAAGTSAEPVVELRADLTPVRLSFARRLEKAAGAPLALVARVRGSGGLLRFEAELEAAGLDLRPGGSIDKRPGDRLRLAVTGARRDAGPGSRIEISALTLALLDTTARASGWAELAPGRTRFEATCQVDRLDADRLLLQAPPPAAGAPAPPGPAHPGSSPWTGLSGTASLQVAEATSKRQKVTGVQLRLGVKEDEVTLEEGRIGLWSGTVDLAGTRARLAPADRPFQLRARATQVQLGALLAAFTDKKVAEARLDAQVELAGKGEGTDAIMKALDGTVDGTLFDGVFHGKDLVAEVLEPVVKAVPSLRGSVTRGGATSLGKALPFSLRVQGGRARLQRPIELTDRGTTMTASGDFGLDGELDLPMTLALSPAAVAEATGGRARVDRPLPFTFKLEGKAWSPRLTGLDVRPAVLALGESIGLRAIGQALGLKAPGAAAPGGDGPAPAAGQAEAEAAARKKARDEADAARKKLEKDGKKLLKGLLGG